MTISLESINSLSSEIKSLKIDERLVYDQNKTAIDKLASQFFQLNAEAMKQDPSLKTALDETRNLLQQKYRELDQTLVPESKRVSRTALGSQTPPTPKSLYKKELKTLSSIENELRVLSSEDGELE